MILDSMIHESRLKVIIVLEVSNEWVNMEWMNIEIQYNWKRYS